jgi:hypothetical protein
METISRNQARLQAAGNALQQTDSRLVSLFHHEQRLAAFVATESQAILSYVSGLYANQDRPGDSDAQLFAISRSEASANLAAMRGLLETLRHSPELAEAQEVVPPLVAEYHAAREAVATDKRNLDDARCKVENTRRELEERALQAIVNDPSLVRLELDLAAAEGVLAGTVDPDPAELERQEKARAAIAKVKRKGEPLAIEALV